LYTYERYVEWFKVYSNYSGVCMRPYGSQGSSDKNTYITRINNITNITGMYQVHHSQRKEPYGTVSPSLDAFVYKKNTPKTIRFHCVTESILGSWENSGIHFKLRGISPKYSKLCFLPDQFQATPQIIELLRYNPFRDWDSMHHWKKGLTGCICPAFSATRH